MTSRSLILNDDRVPGIGWNWFRGRNWFRNVQHCGIGWLLAFITEEKTLQGLFLYEKKKNNSFSWTVSFIIKNDNTSPFVFVCRSLSAMIYVNILVFDNNIFNSKKKNGILRSKRKNNDKERKTYKRKSTPYKLSHFGCCSLAFLTTIQIIKISPPNNE